MSVKNFETFGLFERAAKAVLALCEPKDTPEPVRGVIQTCALAVRGESLAWAEENDALADWKHYYNNSAPLPPERVSKLDAAMTLLRQIKADGYAGEFLPQLDEILTEETLETYDKGAGA